MIVEESPASVGIREAAQRIAPFIRRTPVIEWRHERGTPAAWLKLESLQHAGSFKTRGAFANLLLRTVPPAGVVAASGGNHGAAVAYAAQRLGVRATIFVPTISSPAKVERIRQYGADLVVTGDSYADALAASEAWARERDVLQIHAFDQVETILGQGTLALECEEQVPNATAVLTPVGGGGLLAGIAAWCRPCVRVYGVEPEGAPTLTRALATGAPIDVPIDTNGAAADALGARRLGNMVFEIVSSRVAGAILVTDEEIRMAQRYLWDSLRLLVEPGGATALAALLTARFVPAADDRVIVVISGGNTTPFTVARNQ